MTPQFGGDFQGMQVEQASISQRETEAFDEEAFARAFEEASRSEMDVGQSSSQGQDLGLEQDIMINESAERMMEAESDQLMAQERLGADLIHDPSSDVGHEQEQKDDPDALARTAALVLDSVKDNQSNKFQNSQFLELMRQLRDREVTVEGDKIVGMHTDDQAIKVAAP